MVEGVLGGPKRGKYTSNTQDLRERITSDSPAGIGVLRHYRKAPEGSTGA